MPLGNPGEFDAWAESYDRAVREDAGFPFLDYERVLDRVVERALPLTAASSVVDLGIGTGNLAARFLECGCRVWGLDFSARMLDAAARKLPGVPLARCDLLGPWPDAIPRRHDRLVSAYVFHHLDLEEKIALLARLVRDHLQPRGRIVVGDIAFPGEAARDAVREKWAASWDEEHYWLADKIVPALRSAGLDARHEQVGPLAGVFVITAKGDEK